jgi:Protein of unknown function (DUF1559)
MKLRCLTCEAIRQTFGEYSDPSILCPACRDAALDLAHPMRSPNRNARKRKDDDDDDDEDSRSSSSGGDVATAAGTAAGVAGLGIGMILLIVGGLAACCLCVPAIGVALMIPAIQKFREAAVRTQSINNVREIAMASHAYHDAFKHLPPPQMLPQQPNAPAPDLSWRVAILERGINPGLFRDFDRTQNWDAGKNVPLGNRMPMQFSDIWNPGGMSQTRYQYFTGPNTPFPQPLTKMTLVAFQDGTSNTFLFAEGAATVPWAKAADITNGPAGIKTGDFFIAAMADSSARVIQRRSANDDVLRKVIDPRDGQPLPVGWGD